jgi:hypothetical protein
MDAVHTLPAAQKKVTNSIIMLTLRSIWLERNAWIFDDASSLILRVLDVVLAQWEIWVTWACISGWSVECGVLALAPFL